MVVWKRSNTESGKGVSTESRSNWTSRFHILTALLGNGILYESVLGHLSFGYIHILCPCLRLYVYRLNRLIVPDWMTNNSITIFSLGPPHTCMFRSMLFPAKSCLPTGCALSTSNAAIGHQPRLGGLRRSSVSIFVFAKVFQGTN